MPEALLCPPTGNRNLASRTSVQPADNSLPRQPRGVIEGALRAVTDALHGFVAEQLSRTRWRGEANQPEIATEVARVVELSPGAFQPMNRRAQVVAQPMTAIQPDMESLSIDEEALAGMDEASFDCRSRRAIARADERRLRRFDRE